MSGRIRQTASAGYKFESPADAGLSNCSADAGLSNCSIGAEAPAAAFGKTASADFASARYNNGKIQQPGFGK